MPGWVIGKPPGCVFGSLSKQYGASPAVLCKHPGPDPKRSKNSFSQSSLRGWRLSSCAWSMTRGQKYSDNFEVKETDSGSWNVLEGGLRVSHTNGTSRARVYKTLPEAIKNRGVKDVSADILRGKYPCAVSSTFLFPLFSRFPL